jgi:hypothetical protein
MILVLVSYRGIEKCVLVNVHDSNSIDSNKKKEQPTNATLKGFKTKFKTT